MTRITTNYTTYDLAYYYADLQRLPRLSLEERQQLIITLAHRTPVDTQARNRLIEDHLRLATHIAIDRCPPSYYRCLPDILGEVALTLVNFTHRYDFRTDNGFTAYVASWMDAAVKRTIASDRLHPKRCPLESQAKRDRRAALCAATR